MQICVRTLHNESLSIEIESTATVYELKELIQRQHKVPVETQELFHHGRLLKDKRSLSTYKIDAKSTMDQPLLLSQIFNVEVFVSKKILSIYSFTNNQNEKYYQLPAQQTIECNAETTVNSMLQQLHLSNLSHLLKVCVGSGTDDIMDIHDLDQKLMDLPNLLNDGFLSILFSARWFLDRTVDITSFSSMMSRTIKETVNAAKLLKSCVTFNRLDHQFGKTQSFILKKFEEIDDILQDQSDEIQKAAEWFQNIIQDNVERKVDDDAQGLFNQLQNKVENIGNTLKAVQRKWVKKRKEIVLYLQKIVRCVEIELMKSFRNWLSIDVVQWLQYMDHRIVLTDITIKRFQEASINGYTLSDINDLSLKLMGIDNGNLRVLIIGYIDQLMAKYGDKSSCSARSSPHSPHSDDSDNNYCCICAVNEVNTVIVPCGHATYCTDCSKESIKHSNRCPICRQKVTSIITVYKAGLQFSENN